MYEAVVIEEHSGFGRGESSRVIDMIIARDTERIYSECEGE